MVISGGEKSSLPQKIWKGKQPITYEGHCRGHRGGVSPLRLYLKYKTSLPHPDNYVVIVTILELNLSAFSL